MENNSFQTSFIPKRPINTTSGSSISSSRERHSNPFVTFSVIILILTIVATGGLYLYKSILIKQKDNLSASLEKVKNSFDQKTISDLELFNKRISASSDILSNHVVLSPMFKLLGDLTIPSIQYTKFSNSSTDKGFTVVMSGVAPDYQSIASQANVFNSDNGRLFKNVVFSNLNKDLNNKVTFDVTFNVDPSLLSYQNDINKKSQ